MSGLRYGIYTSDQQQSADLVETQNKLVKSCCLTRKPIFLNSHRDPPLSEKWLYKHLAVMFRSSLRRVHTKTLAMQRQLGFGDSMRPSCKRKT